MRATMPKRGRKAVKRAGKTGRKAAKQAAAAGSMSQERAAEMAERAGVATREAADHLAERVRTSEALARAQAAGSTVAGRARGAWNDAEIDARLAELGERMRESEAGRRAAGRTREVTDTSLAAMGQWLTRSRSGRRVGKRMGVQRRRRWPMAVAALVGVAGGLALGRSMADGERHPMGLVGEPERFPDYTGGPPPTLAETVRTSLSSDPRTATLTELEIDVAEGTVFVRGTAPPEVDRGAVREVIAAVPGVRDVDLQLAGTP